MGSLATQVLVNTESYEMKCIFMIRPDMTEKLLTGTLSLNTTNHIYA